MTQTQASTPNSLTRFVPLKNLRLEIGMWTNPRTQTGLDKDKIAELAASIKQHHSDDRCGVLDPPHVQQVTVNGELYDLVIDGQRRVRSASTVLSKDTLIPVYDLNPTPRELTQDVADELLMIALDMGSKREGLSSFELSEVAEDLRKRNKTLAQISKAINKSESWISKILKARATASPKLMKSWRSGEITDEQFKSLAEEKDETAQAKQADAVVEARRSGDKSEARARAAEVRETKKTERVAERVTNGHGKRPNGVGKPVVAGPQLDLIKSDPAKPTPPKAKPISQAVFEDLRHMASKRPPTHDYVKGIMDGVAYAMGVKNPTEFGKPWLVYIARHNGGSITKPKGKAKARGVSRATKRVEKKAKKARARKAKK